MSVAVPDRTPSATRQTFAGELHQTYFCPRRVVPDATTPGFRTPASWYTGLSLSERAKCTTRRYFARRYISTGLTAKASANSCPERRAHQDSDACSCCFDKVQQPLNHVELERVLAPNTFTRSFNDRFGLHRRGFHLQKTEDAF